MRVILLMGVSGSGKTAVGRLLAEKLRCPFYDGDQFHPQENLAKMAQGLPLNDRDRRPWLAAIRNLLVSLSARKTRAVVACSALKRDYRDLLSDGLPGLRLVYLKAGYAVLEGRLKSREGHFFKAGLLSSQLEILEEPEEALSVDAEAPLESVVASILEGLASDPALQGAAAPENPPGP